MEYDCHCQHLSAVHERYDFTAPVSFNVKILDEVKKMASGTCKAAVFYGNGTCDHSCNDVLVFDIIPPNISSTGDTVIYIKPIAPNIPNKRNCTD